MTEKLFKDWGRIFKEATELMDKRFTGGRKDRACLYWAKATYIALRRHIKNDAVAIMAGSTQWRRVEDKDSDSACFGYIWSPEEAPSRVLVSRGGLPEMHVWVYLPYREMIIDCTTQYQAARCKALLGLDWETKYALPPYIAMTIDEAEEKFWQYRPNPMATHLAIIKLLEREW